MTQRNGENEHDKVPRYLLNLYNQTRDLICTVQVHHGSSNSKGEENLSQTLFEMIVALQILFHMRKKYYKFLSDAEFIEGKNTLENTMKMLSKKGKVLLKSAEPISEETEDKIWTEGLLGISSPEVQLNTIVYLFGVHLALHAVQEHKSLKVDTIRSLYVMMKLTS